jgi:FMN phosphatase YigB (HAD superfamily)
MKFVQELYRYIAKEVYGKYTFEMGEHTVDFAEEWAEVDFSSVIEKEFGVDRATYFAATWNVSPEKYIEPNDDARAVLSALEGRCAVLTEAPRVWAEAALRFLNVYELVQDMLFTGEPDIRKPSIEVFNQVGTVLGGPFDSIYSVGDQEESDIIFARAAGMKTIMVGDEETSADFCVRNVQEILGLPIDVHGES